MKSFQARVRRELDRCRRGRSLSMVASSLGLIGGKGILLGLGFFFWLLAARVADPSEVGLTGGVISAIMLCVQISLLGVGFAFIGHYPAHRDRPHRLLDSAITIVAVASVVVAALFLLLAKGASRELNLVESVPAYAMLFLGMSVVGTVVALLDPVSMAQGRGDQILLRNLANGILTIAALVLFPLLGWRPGSMALFACWVAGSLSACLLGLAQLWRARRYRYRPRLERSLARALMAKGLPNQILGVVEKAPGLILAILVTELLSPTDNAYWYTVWMMAWGAYMIPVSISIALFAEASHRPAGLKQQTRRAVRSSLALGVPVAGAMIVLAHPLLSLLGPDYAAHGTTPLRILVLALVPLTFFQAYMAVCRAYGRLTEAVGAGVISVGLAVAAGAQAGLTWGLSGIAASWVITQCFSGAWAAWRIRRLSQRPVPGTGEAERPAPPDDWDRVLVAVEV